MRSAEVDFAKTVKGKLLKTHTFFPLRSGTLPKFIFQVFWWHGDGFSPVILDLSQFYYLTQTHMYVCMYRRCIDYLAVQYFECFFNLATYSKWEFTNTTFPRIFMIVKSRPKISHQRKKQTLRTGEEISRSKIHSLLSPVLWYPVGGAVFGKCEKGCVSKNTWDFENVANCLLFEKIPVEISSSIEIWNPNFKV